MNERDGCALLKARFEAAGFRIREGYPYRSGNIAFAMDGFDPVAAVGFEYVTTAAGDREEITPAVLRHLEKRIAAGELAILLLDERDELDAELISFAADRFLAEVKRAMERSRKPGKVPGGKNAPRKSAKKKGGKT